MGSPQEIIQIWSCIVPAQLDHMAHPLPRGSKPEHSSQCPGNKVLGLGQSRPLRPPTLIKCLALFWLQNKATLCHAIVFPGRRSGFLYGFRSDSCRESLNIGPPAGRRPAGGQILRPYRLESGRNPARKTDFRLRSLIA